MIDFFTQYGCSIKRIRRSKNWLLTGKQNELVEINKQLQHGFLDNKDCKKVIWIAEAINEALPKPNFDLVTIIQTNPDMTINRLIEETGCTLIEARAALDKSEDFI